MKTIKFIFIMAATVLLPRVWGAEPPETMNIHQRAGSVVSMAFSDFRHLEFSGDRLLFVGSGAPVSVKMADISKITFGEYHKTVLVPVSFNVYGNVSGTLSATIVGTGRTLRSGDEVEAGNTVLFEAVPNRGSKVRGWRINGDYVTDVSAKRSVQLDENRHANGLRVEVEFVKDVGLEDALNGSMLNVYVRGREIWIESASCIEQVEMLDVGGRLHRVETISGRSHQISFSAGNVASGVYVLRIRTSGKRGDEKVIIR